MKEVNKGAWNVGKMLMFLLSCAASLAVAQENPAIKQAAYLLETDQPTKAVAALQAAVSASPQDAALLYYLGHAQIKNNEKAKAEINFQKGIELDPKNGLNFAGKGQLRVLDNHAAEAKLAFDEALKISKSKDDEVLKAVAEGYLLDGKLAKDALALLEKIKGKDVEAAVLRGDAYLKLNDGGKAVSSYENGATYDTKRALPHYKVGLVYLRSKNYDVAEQNFKKATEVDPKYTLAFKELGELYYESRKAKEAVTSYESYMALTEKPEAAKLRYAFFLFMAKEYKRANPIFDELSKRPDATATVYKYKAYALTESKEFAAAQTAFDAYFAKAKKEEIQASDYEYLGKMLEESGNDSLAVENYQKSFDLEKKEAVAAKIAELVIKAKKYPEAVTAYEQLESVRPKLGSAELYGQGRAYYYTEQYTKSDSTFQKLIALQPGMTLGYLWQARSIAALDPEVNGKIKGTAKPYFEKVVEVGLQRADKSKNDLIEAYSYLGYYHFTTNEIAVSKSFWEKVLALNPNDARATEILKAMNAPAQKPAPKKQG